MQPKEEKRHSAVLLIGPTGSGKTPLGQLMQQRGLWGMRCLHFDFGHELRLSIRGSSNALTEAERELVSHMLRRGALLEDEHFPIAYKLLNDFIVRGQADLKTLVILNGLPRHIGQAEHLKEIVRLQAVVNLECTPDTVLRRISNNTGGDRTRRIDDSLEEVKRKLEIFRQRTAPLVNYYKAQNVGIISVDVGPLSTAADMLDKIENYGTTVDTYPA